MGLLVWIVIGILAGNAVLFGGLLIGYRVEERKRKKNEQRGIR